MNLRLFLKSMIILLVLRNYLLCNSVEIEIKTKEKSIAGTQQFVKIKFIIRNQSKNDIKMAKGSDGLIYYRKYGTYFILNIEGPINEKVMLKPPVSRTPPKAKMPYLEIKAGGSYVIEGSLRGYGICNPGRYKLQAEYRGDLAPAGYFNEIIKSKEYEIEVEEPKGIDKLVYEDWFKVSPIIYEKEYNRKGRQLEKSWCNFGIGCSQYYLEWLLNKFPTSTYTGFALLRCPNSLSISLNPELLLEEAINIKYEKKSRHCTGRVEINSKGEYVWIYPEEVSRRYIKVASKFIEAHPDFYGSGVIYTQLGTAYTILNEWQNAKESYEKALKASWDNYPEDKKEEVNKIKGQISRMINLLVEKKLAK